MSTRFQLGALVLSLAALAACRQDMHDQPKYIPLRPSTFFDDGRSARPIPANTVARGHLDEDVAYYTGRDASGKLVTEFPFPVTKEILLRGQNRFNIYCTPCHDRTGSGNGMVPQRGFRHPPRYHIERLVRIRGTLLRRHHQRPRGHAGLSAQVAPADRWAIAAYIRALQFSQQATINDVPAAGARPTGAGRRQVTAAAHGLQRSCGPEERI